VCVAALPLTRANDQPVRRALENAGVQFIDAYNGGPGVRLRHSPDAARCMCPEISPPHCHLCHLSLAVEMKASRA
jgi:hypothetical protein